MGMLHNDSGKNKKWPGHDFYLVTKDENSSVKLF